MSDFKGKNSLKNLKLLYSERSKYLSEAFTVENQDGTRSRRAGISDINSFETVFNARVDLVLDSIFPLDEPQNTVIKYGRDLDIRGVNFAVDALTEFISYFNGHVVGNNSFDQEHPYLSNITVYRSYDPPELKYQRYIASIMDKMITSIKDNNHNNSIHNFNDFVNYLLNFLSNGKKRVPFTKAAWQKSSKSTIFTSGLAFSIANLPCDDDSVKEEQFLDANKNNLNLYIQAAQDYGFSISLQCPWILIFNPFSVSYKVTQSGNGFLRKYNHATPNSVYINSYKKVFKEDIDNLKLILINYYNILINIFPYYRTITETNSKTTTKIYYRDPITADNIETYYTDKQLHTLYSKIRNIEEGDYLGKAAMDIIEKKLTFFYDKLDRYRCLSYINEQFRYSLYTASGGINEYLTKLKNSELEE